MRPAPGGGLRVRPLAFSAVAMMTVLGALALAFYLFEISGVRIFLERERGAAIAERDVLLDKHRQEGVAQLAVGVDRLTRHAARGEIYGLFDSAGRPIAGAIQALPPVSWGAEWQDAEVVAGGQPVRVKLSATRLPDGAALLVGRDQAGTREYRDRMRDSFLVGMAIVVAASLGVGMALNAVVARRAQSVAEVAERIARGEFGTRAEVSPRGDVFDRIGASLNDMLDRIEALVTGMRTVTDSLTHDLRTPLTHVRAAIESAAEGDPDPDACRGALETVRVEVDSLLAVLTTLMDIARAESGLSEELMQELDLRDLALEMAELFSPVLEDAGQTLEIEATHAINAKVHDGLLRQAVGNLLHNAALHAGPGARVRLEVLARDGAAEIVVADTGPGIPEAERARVRQRFVQLNGARNRGGSGLGLAIVEAAAKLHKGELRLEDNNPGVRAVLCLRLSRREAAAANM